MITQNKINYKNFLNKEETVKEFIKQRNEILSFKQKQNNKILYNLIIKYKKYNNKENIKIHRTM
jgi:hypothetical protein